MAPQHFQPILYSEFQRVQFMTEFDLTDPHNRHSIVGTFNINQVFPAQRLVAFVGIRCRRG